MKHLMYIALLLSVGCATTPKKSCPKPQGPYEAALQWASKGFKKSKEASTWRRAHVLRVWRGDNVWRAVVAPKRDARKGPAVKLVIRQHSNSWSVYDVKPTTATELWPSLQGE